MKKTTPADQMPAGGFLMTGKSDPQVGQRWTLTHRVEKFPHFSVDAGKQGTITEVSDHLICLKMDETIPGAEEWDNEICWSLDDCEDFHADCSLIA